VAGGVSPWTLATGNANQSQRIPYPVFRIMRHKGGLGAAGSQPALFPVALVEAVMTAFTDAGDLIHEPFCGSGTQLIAAERVGRRCFSMGWILFIVTWPCDGGRWRRGRWQKAQSFDFEACGEQHIKIAEKYS